MQGIITIYIKGTFQLTKVEKYLVVAIDSHQFIFVSSSKCMYSFTVRFFKSFQYKLSIVY